jgi:lipoic acid synthetase
VLDARPDVLNHNTETVPRLYRWRVRRQVPARARTARAGAPFAPDIPTKTGIMVGLGETFDEVVDVHPRLAQGRLPDPDDRPVPAPVARPLPMDRYWTPDEFRELKRIALELGFGHVESGPLVRSSYHAHEQADSYQRLTAIDRFYRFSLTSAGRGAYSRAITSVDSFRSPSPHFSEAP